MILFLTLNTFDATGGIEKVCRIAGKAFFEYGIENNEQILIKSLHDSEKAAYNNSYFPRNIFKGYKGNIPVYIFKTALIARRARVVVLSHVNLLPVGWLIKFLSPKTKLILITHGIEIWNPLKIGILKMLRKCDRILAVSSYTRNRIIEVHKIAPEKCCVLNNCLDPFLQLPQKNSNLDLRERYGFGKEDKIIFTLTRISAEERYKGYDKVIEALALLQEKHPSAKYLISGSADATEKKKIIDQVKSLKIEDKVVLSGFIAETEIADHFQLADVYIMPSKKEGFGIVFIEAMFYKLPVIAGNTDGSTDALLSGKLGILVDPDNIITIKDSLDKILSGRNSFIPDPKILMSNFGYQAYKEHIENLVCRI